MASGISKLISAAVRRTGRLTLSAGLVLAAISAGAQAFDKMTGDQLMSLMRAQPRLDMEAPVAPTAKFDPPVIAPGGRAIYRVTLRTLDEAITRWPDQLPVPPQLELVRGAEGMIFNMAGGTMKPLTEINYHATATQAGVYVMPSFVVEIYGQPVTVPEARLEVQAGNPGLPNARQLLLEPARTNVYVGQSVRVRVQSPAAENRSVQALTQVQLNGDGFITGKSDVRQEISPVRLPDGRQFPAFIYETSLTPFAQGPLRLSAQGFTAGNQFGGQVIIQGGVTIPGGPPEFALLEADPVTLNVQPLPVAGRLPGFIGAIGKFTRDTPQLSATVTQAGNPIKLTVTIHSAAGINHLAMPPAAETPAWQSFAAGSPVISGNGATFTYTLIPQTDQTAATPEIPFSFFDPDQGQYFDLSIPAVPVKVLPAATTAGTTNDLTPLASVNVPEKKLSLGNLAPAMGATATSLVPLQQRGWFFRLELGPVLGLLALWLESRRRQFWEQHPDLSRRRDARRALRREWRTLRQAAQTGDASGFASSSVTAIRLACAPHFPAEPRALVCGDVLQLLPEAERTGENGRVVRRLFLATDTLNFAGTAGEFTGLLELQPQLDRLLTDLEARL